MCRFAGCCRFLWNKSLELQKDRHTKGLRFLTFADLCRELTSWKSDSEFNFLKDAQGQVLQQSLRFLSRAINEARCSGSKGFPKYKKKGRHDAFTYPQRFKINEDQSRIYLPKIGWVRYRNSRSIVGEIKNVTVSRSGEKWFVSVQVEQEVVTPVHIANHVVGIDLGVRRFATLSSGEIYRLPKNLASLERKILRAHQALDRKTKHSRNWLKQGLKLRKLYQKTKDVRLDFLHKTSSEITRAHAVVVLENLRVSVMTRSAAGSLKNPGTGVRRKAGLNRSIRRQGWGEFRRQLEYKQLWNGGQVIAINPKHTSQRCHQCGFVSIANRPSIEAFRCQDCGLEQHADLNAAKNILAAGHAVMACGGMVQQGRPVKQESVGDGSTSLKLSSSRMSTIVAAALVRKIVASIAFVVLCGWIGMVGSSYAELFKDESGLHGYYWYEDPVNEEEPELEKLMPTPLIPFQPESFKDPVALKEALKRLPIDNIDLVKLPAAWLKVLLTAKRDKALDEQSEENLLQYLKVHKETFNRAQRFTDMWQVALYTHPDLDFTSTNPSSNVGHEIYAETKKDEEDKFLASLREQAGLFFFFTSTCPYCQKQSQLLKMFADTYGWTVKAVTRDGYGLPEFPDAMVDNGMGDQVGVTRVPMIFLAIPNEEFVVPIGAGLITLDEVRERTLKILKQRFALKRPSKS
jgi:putative transposase